MGGGSAGRGVPAGDGAGLVAEILREAASEAGRLRASGVVSAEFERELDSRFESAAVRALRVPAIAERSVRARSVARRVVPARARPAARRIARAGDRVLRAAFARIDVARRRP
ncbi:MAG: hypothetical protein M0Z33_06285 [Actinomycetota bacterium]|nr:hypothetical protein [Actinomycetota bacterium]